MKNTNRIESACWYREVHQTPRTQAKWVGGTLRAWSTDHQEYENGPGQFPVGVVEDDATGCCKSIHVMDICFAAIPPSK